MKSHTTVGTTWIHTEELNAWTAIRAGLYKVQQQVKINYAI